MGDMVMTFGLSTRAGKRRRLSLTSEKEGNEKKKKKKRRDTGWGEGVIRFKGRVDWYTTPRTTWFRMVQPPTHSCVPAYGRMLMELCPLCDVCMYIQTRLTT